jgi:drug/metabolite transporter (DMT)-like permease
MEARTASRLQLFATALLFSTGGTAIKAVRLTGWQVASLRSLIAAASIALLVPAARRWTWKSVLVGAAYSVTLVFYVLANKLTTAANAIFLQYTAPLYLIVLGPWLLREKVRRSDLWYLTSLAVGMSVFFLARQNPLPTATDPAAGNLLGALSGASWALTIAGLRWLEKQTGTAEHGLAAVAAGNLITGIACLPKTLPVTGASLTDWMVILYLGVFQIGLAYAFLTRAVRYAPALESSLLLCAEPALNPLWAWLVHDEKPSAAALAAGALILTATIIKTIKE